MEKRHLTIREISLYAMLGAVMFASKKLMEMIPNVHLLALFIVTFTVVYRKKALYPIYIYVLMDGIFGGFSLWWYPYLYIWTMLFFMTMLLPKRMPQGAAVPVYALTAGLHGLMFGTLYAPYHALVFGLNFKGLLAWIAAGFPYDCIHAVSNFCFGLFVVPLSAAMRQLNRIIFPDITGYRNEPRNE